MYSFRRRALTTLATCAGVTALLTGAAPTMGVEEIRPGMVGIGRTVFDGTKVEEFRVNILGVLENVIGPHRNLVLARLEGGPLADTGVIAGMSGSPVYIDGRLIGAVSYALGSFSKEPIAGVTPITPTVLRKDVSTLSFVADDATEKEIFTLLDGLGVRWRLRGRQAVRLGQESGTDLTPRQRELLSLAWNLGYFDIPARADLRKIADLTGLSRNTVSQHLRRGMRRILREWIA